MTASARYMGRTGESEKLAGKMSGFGYFGYPAVAKSVREGTYMDGVESK